MLLVLCGRVPILPAQVELVAAETSLGASPR
jgi:hypothetical protein